MVPKWFQSQEGFKDAQKGSKMVQKEGLYHTVEDQNQPKKVNRFPAAHKIEAQNPLGNIVITFLYVFFLDFSYIFTFIQFFPLPFSY